MLCEHSLRESQVEHSALQPLQPIKCFVKSTSSDQDKPKDFDRLKNKLGEATARQIAAAMKRNVWEDMHVPRLCLNGALPPVFACAQGKRWIWKHLPDTCQAAPYKMLPRKDQGGAGQENCEMLAWQRVNTRSAHGTHAARHR